MSLGTSTSSDCGAGLPARGLTGIRELDEGVARAPDLQVACRCREAHEAAYIQVLPPSGDGSHVQYFRPRLRGPRVPEAHSRRPRAARRLVARRELSLGRADLSLRQPAAPRAALARTHQAAAARPLGDHAGAELR